MALKKAVFYSMVCWWSKLSLFSDASGQLDILGHDGHPLGVNSTQVGVLKQTNEVCLCCFLKCTDGSTLETQICLEILSNFSYQSLEGKLSDKQLGRLLVATNSQSSTFEASECLRASRASILDAATRCLI